MKSASALLVPATTLLLIISAASLAFEASEAADAAAMAGAGLDRARQSAGEVAAALAALPPPAGVPEPAGAEPAPPPDVNSVLAHTLVRLQKQARARLVAIERITANKQQGYAGADALAAPVPMTGNRILAVRLQMHGRYADYPLFKAFLDDLGHLAAIQSLKVVGDRFEAQLEIYGVGNV